MKLFSFLVVALVGLTLTSCHTSIGDARKVGVYTYKGVQYDIYRATEFDENSETPVLVLVKEGADPLAFGGSAIIARCLFGADFTQKHCNRVFGEALEKRLSVSDPTGGSDY